MILSEDCVVETEEVKEYCNEFEEEVPVKQPIIAEEKSLRELLAYYDKGSFMYNIIKKLLFFYCDNLPLVRTYVFDEVFTSEFVFENQIMSFKGLPAPTIDIAMETVIVITAEKLRSNKLIDEHLLPELTLTPFHKLKIPRSLFFTQKCRIEDVYHLYIIKLKLTPMIDDFHEAFYPCKSHKIQGYGILTAARLPEQIPAFIIYPRYGEAVVEVTYAGEIIVEPPLIPLYTWFQNMLFANILSIKIEAGVRIPIKNYFVLPVHKLKSSQEFKIANKFLRDLHKSWDPETKNWRYNDFDIDLTDSIVDAILVQHYRFEDPSVSYQEMEEANAFFVAAGVSDKMPKDMLRSEVSYEEYYKQKYGLELTKPDTPLIKVRHISKKYNMLFKRSDDYNVDDFIAEYCKIHPFPASLWNQATCLPTILWRVECFTLAFELFTRITPLKSLPIDSIAPRNFLQFNDCLSDRALRSDLRFVGHANWLDVLQCISTKACMEEFDLERLEFLGDSVLKYLTSLFLFVTLPTAREGLLSQFKGKIVGNKNLAVQATKYLDLPKYVLCDIFYPKCRWIPPGAMPDRCKPPQGGNSDNLDELYNSIPDKYLHSMTIKDVADCCEAIIGLCFSKYGIRVAADFLDFIDVLANGKQHQLKDYAFLSPAPSLQSLPAELDYLVDLQKIIGYNFTDMKYLYEATLHPSYHKTSDNYQRLEFLGDAILDILIVCYIYREHLHFQPGQLTDLRSNLVRNTTLAKICYKYRFYDYLLYDSESVACVIQREKDRRDNFEGTGPGEILEIDAEAEDDNYKKFFGDLVEAFIGAIYLDCKGDCSLVWAVIKPWFKEHYTLFLKELTLKEEVLVNAEDEEPLKMREGSLTAKEHAKEDETKAEDTEKLPITENKEQAETENTKSLNLRNKTCSETANEDIVLHAENEQVNPENGKPATIEKDQFAETSTVDDHANLGTNECQEVCEEAISSSDLIAHA